MNDYVFLDTVGLIALLNQDDQYHHRAAEAFARIGQTARKVITTDLVLAELGNSLARTALREDVFWLIRQLHEDRSSTVLYVTRQRFHEALELYHARQDKSWGLVDCVSFTVMRSKRLIDAFTADHHFEQAGFNCLLRVTGA